MDRTRILLADDHALVAEALADYLRKHFDLQAVVGDGATLIQQAKLLAPDVIILDFSMPGMNGLECVKRLRDHNARCKVIVLTMHNDPELASELLRAGAMGYVLKQSAGEELITAVREVVLGRPYLSKEIAAPAMRVLASPSAGHFQRLSPRQREVLQLVAAGRSMKEIAGDLRISRRTVETYKYGMMELLDIHSTAELVQYAIKHHVLAG